jgi:hypothetical protein
MLTLPITTNICDGRYTKKKDFLPLTHHDPDDPGDGGRVQLRADELDEVRSASVMFRRERIAQLSDEVGQGGVQGGGGRCRAAPG